MNITDAVLKARALMNAHGLSHVPVELDRGKRRLGACYFRRATGEVTKISFSQHFIPLLSEAEFVDTVLHEIAHAKAGHDAGHGPVWKAHARMLGATPKRCADASVQAPEAAWKGHCTACGYVSSGFHRAPLRLRSCSKCSKGVFNKTFLLTWRKNGKPVPLDQMPARYQSEFRRTMHGGMMPTKFINI